MERLRETVVAGVVAILGWGAVAAAGPKSTIFDLDKDLWAFFNLNARIRETEPRDDETPAARQKKQETRRTLFQKHGIRDEKHWEKESQAGFGYSYTKRAEKIYGGEARIMNIRRAADDGKTLEQYVKDRMDQDERIEKAQERLKLLHNPDAFNPALLAPIEGVSLEQYAAASNAATFFDGFAPVAKETGISEAKYDRVTEKWTERMRADPTFLLMKKYGAYFMGAARGRFAAAGKSLGQSMLTDQPLQGPEPLTMEKWVEITEFYGAHQAEIKGPADVTRILKPYGLTFYEWNLVSNWWGHKRTQALKAQDRQFITTWTTLREKYRRQFGAKE